MKNIRRGLCLALAIIMILTCLSALLMTVHAADYAGDVDGSGSINFFDAMMINQYAVGLISKLSNGDVNGDGTVNNIDAVLVLKYYAGLISGFPEAAPPVYSDASVTVSASNATTAPGDTISIDICVLGADICSYLMTLEYDKTALKLESLISGSDPLNMTIANPYSGAMVAAGDSNLTPSGSQFTATFKVLTEEAGVYPVTVKADNVINANMEHLNVNTVTGCVTVEIPHTVHTWTEWETTQKATCTTDGQQIHTCTECGLTETRNISKLAHSYESAVTNPTCTQQGYTTYTCTVCGYSYTGDHRNALGHFFGDWALISSPTCTAGGETRRSCGLCGEVETITFPATGHSYENGICANCGLDQKYDPAISCGENLTWKFDAEANTLTISGTGPMYDYTEGTAPWMAYADKLYYIIIESGITYIGDYAFYGLQTHWDGTVIPDTVTAIGNHSFACEYPIKVHFLGDAPEIEADSFSNMIGDIRYPYSNPTWTQKFKDACGGTIIWSPYDDEGKYIDMGGAGEDLIWILHQSGELELIGSGAMRVFNSSLMLWWEHGYEGRITSVTIPEGVTEIRKLAFAEMKNVTSITIPSTVTSIGNGAFSYCTALTEIYFKGDAPAFVGTGLNDEEFTGVTATTYYPEGNETWTEDVLQNHGGALNWTPYEAVTMGDASGDGGIDNVDAMMILQYTVGLLDASRLELAACDVNDDGSIDNVDAMQILQYTVGLITEFRKA